MLTLKPHAGKEGSIRFYNATSQGEGIVENCRGGFWRAVCDMNWSYLNSFVVCRQLGLPATGIINFTLISLYYDIQCFRATIVILYSPCHFMWAWISVLDASSCYESKVRAERKSALQGSGL